MNALARLRTFAGKGRTGDRCSLCGNALEARHSHVVHVARGETHCSCLGCSILFDRPEGTLRRVPDRVVRLDDFRMTDEQWRALDTPVGLAFFRKSTPRGEVIACYPSPLGPVESSVSAGAWESLLRDNPPLRSLDSDVEALLIRRAGSRKEQFIAPLDECQGMIGLLRREWRGFSGGDEVERALERFFRILRERSGDLT